MISRIPRHRVILVLFLITFSIVSYSSSDKDTINGNWINHRAKIIFGQGDSLKINLRLLPEKNGVFVYNTVPVGKMELIRYSKSLSDKSSQFLLIADKNDTTANISYGVPFVRVSGEKGIFGTWKNTRDLSEVRWDIGVDFIEYNDSYLDINTGFKLVKESHRGTYTAGVEGNSGRLFINFSDGVNAVILPIVFDKIMYIFDMTPRRALFKALKEIPVSDSLNTGKVAFNDSTINK